MNDIQQIHNLAKSGADSVFGYIERTAESVPDGIRWQTLNYYNQPQYEVMAFNGVSGISLFLSDYYRLSGESKARVLALGANQWCSAPERTVRGHGLCFGRAGTGMAWLRFSITKGEPKGQKPYESVNGVKK